MNQVKIIDYFHSLLNKFKMLSTSFGLKKGTYRMHIKCTNRMSLLLVTYVYAFQFIVFSMASKRYVADITPLLFKIKYSEALF